MSVAPETTFTGCLRGAARGIYTGPVRTLVTASGGLLRLSLRHPIATRRGWVAAGDLSTSDAALVHVGELGLPRDQLPPSGDELWRTWSLRHGGSWRLLAPRRAFHGEGRRFYGSIEVVGSYRLLGTARVRHEARNSGAPAVVCYSRAVGMAHVASTAILAVGDEGWPELAPTLMRGSDGRFALDPIVAIYESPYVGTVYDVEGDSGWCWASGFALRDS